MKSRGRTEIIADILQALANGGATKTKIMYGAFLSFEQADDYLRYLAERELVHFDEASRRFTITRRGMKLLDVSEGTANLVALAPFDKVGASF